MRLNEVKKKKMPCLNLNEVKLCPTSVRELAGLDLEDWL